MRNKYIVLLLLLLLVVTQASAQNESLNIGLQLEKNSFEANESILIGINDSSYSNIDLSDMFELWVTTSKSSLKYVGELRFPLEFNTVHQGAFQLKLVSKADGITVDAEEFFVGSESVEEVEQEQLSACENVGLELSTDAVLIDEQVGIAIVNADSDISVDIIINHLNTSYKFLGDESEITFNPSEEGNYVVTLVCEGQPTITKLFEVFKSESLSSTSFLVSFTKKVPDDVGANEPIEVEFVVEFNNTNESLPFIDAHIIDFFSDDYEVDQLDFDYEIEKFDGYNMIKVNLEEIGSKQIISYVLIKKNNDTDNTTLPNAFVNIFYGNESLQYVAETVLYKASSSYQSIKMMSSDENYVTVEYVVTNKKTVIEDASTIVKFIRRIIDNIVFWEKVEELSQTEMILGNLEIDLSGQAGFENSRIILNELDITNESSLTVPIEKLEEQAYEVAGKPVLNAYAMDLSQLSFTNGTFITTAKGSELWKCREWDYPSQTCNGVWEKIKDIQPGQQYSIALSPEDPAYAEIGLASINTNKSIYYPGELAQILIVVLDQDGYLVSNANIELIVTTPDVTDVFFSSSLGMVIEIERGVYEALFNDTFEIGNYTMSVYTDHGNMTSEFFVKEYYEFDILRSTPVTVDPWQGPFNSSIKIISYTEDSIFNYTEILPKSFTVYDAGGAGVTTDSNFMYLMWTNLMNASFISYLTTPPLITPELYELKGFVSYSGGLFNEARSWFLAVDPLIENLYDNCNGAGVNATLWGNQTSSGDSGDIYAGSGIYTLDSADSAELTIHTSGIQNFTKVKVDGQALEDLGNGRAWHIGMGTGTLYGQSSCRGNTGWVPNDGYYVCLYGNDGGMQLYEVNSGSESSLDTTAENVATGVYQNYTLEVNSSGVFFFIDDVLKLSSADTTHSAGGYITISTGGGTTNRGTWYINNVWIYNQDNAPIITLESPSANYWNDTFDPLDVTFNCSITDDTNSTNISLYLTNNANTSFAYNDSCVITDVYGTCQWSKSLSNGNYTWNCLGFDESDQSAWDPNRTILINSTTSPPSVSNIGCYATGVGWTSCGNVQYGDTLDVVRTTCTEGGAGSIQNASFSLKNIDDNYVYFNVTTIDNSSGYWEYNVSDVTIQDSGDFKLHVTCRENPEGYGDAYWSVAFGNLTATLVSPASATSVKQNEFFNFTSRVNCTGGECGYVNATLDPPVTVAFNTSGATTWDVPSGVTSITVKMWGGGGAGGAGGSDPTNGNAGDGAGAGFSFAVLSVTPGETLNVLVGGGGGVGVVQGTAPAGGDGGGGGGRTELNRSTTQLMIAAGGGGGGGGDNSGGGSPGGDGGEGGGLTGADGTDSGSSGAGGGATQSAVGAAGTGGDTTGLPGVSFVGGAGGDNNAGTRGNGGAGGVGGGGAGGQASSAAFGGGGGGGSGYFGGGGSSSSAAGDGGAGGGGAGSGYTTGSQNYTSQGSGVTPPNSSDADYIAYSNDAGLGGAGGPDCTDGSCVGTVGNPGLLVINYATKGVVPMNSGTPFYTINQNPMAPANTSCLRNMTDGDYCDTTWTVNATGALNTTWEFFAIYSSLNYSSNVSAVNTSKVNITISEGFSPLLQDIKCKVSSSWIDCDTIDYGDSVESVRANCSSNGGDPVSNVFFNLMNIEDSKTLFSGTESSLTNGFYEYNFTDFNMSDSGDFNLNVSCVGDSTTLQSVDWSIEFGTLSVNLINPSTDVNVTQNLFFNFSNSISCNGGECGWINATLDPIGYMNSGGVAGTSFSFDIGTAGTDRLVVVFVDDESTGTSLSDVTVDSNSCNLVVVADNSVGAGNHQELWYCDEDDLGSSGGSVTVVISGGDAGWGIHAHLYENVSQDGPYNYSIDDTSNGVNTITVNNVDVPADGLVVAGWAEGTGGLSISTQTSPLSTLLDGPDAASTDIFTSYGIESSEQSSKTYSVTLSGAHNRATGIVASWEKSISGGSKGLVPMNSGSPFYTIHENPMYANASSCLANMQAGDICNVSWSVNATGSLGSVWEFFSEAKSQNYSLNVSSAQSTHINITISSNSLPVTETVTLNPIDSSPDENLTCAYNITDENLLDTLTADIKWYKNGVLSYTQAGVSTTNGILSNATLHSDNTSSGDTWICGVTPYDQINYGSELNSSAIDILASQPPVINSLECYDGGAWVNCSTILYNDFLESVRANCTDPDGYVVNVTFTLTNVEDSHMFFTNTTTLNVSDVFTLYDKNITIMDSGTFNLSVSCVDNSSTPGTSFQEWLVPWGVLNGTLVSPNSDINVTQYKYFNFTSSLNCIGGECGSVTATLDPIPGWWDSSWGYRKKVIVTEQSNNNLSDYEINVTIDTQTLVSEGKLQANCSDLRFTDNESTELNHYVKYGCDTTSTEVWVKVNASASTNTTLFVYYGNSSVPDTSDPDATYFIYEDMASTPSGSIIGDAAYIDQSTGVRITTAANNLLGYVYYVRNPGPGFYGTFATWAGGGTGADSTWFGVHDDSVSSTREDIVDGGYHFTVDEWQDRIVFTKSTTDNGAPIASWSNSGLDDSSWHTFEVVFYNDGSSANGLIYYDGILRVNGTDNSPQSTTGQYFLIGGRTGGSTNEHRINNITVRRYVSPEPLVTIESELKGEKGVIPMNSGSPFYTIHSNPMNWTNTSCLANMADGDSCNTTWTVNATGETGNPYEFFVEYGSYNYSSVVINYTKRINITILANQAPYVENVSISPLFAYSEENLTCSFIIYDSNAFDILNATIRWYNSSVLMYTDYTSVTNGVLANVPLYSGNTTNAEYWWCGVTPGDEETFGTEVNSSNASITNIKPPQINEIQCQVNDSTWSDCSNVAYGDIFTGVRANCTADVKLISNVTFNFTNVQDSELYFENNTNTSSSDWMIFYENVTINNSGDFSITAICYDNESAIDTAIESWTVPWGYYVVTLTDPDSDRDVEQNFFFKFTSEISCVSGECGSAIVLLDPESSDVTTSQKSYIAPKRGGNPVEPYGVVSLNSMHDSYLPGEVAEIIIVALDDKGDFIEKKDFLVQIKDEDNIKEIYSPKDVEVVDRGIYKISHKISDKLGAREINLEYINGQSLLRASTSFNVVENKKFDIIRNTSSVIDPWDGPFESSITVVSSEEKFSLAERIPVELEIVDAGGADTWVSEVEKILVWNSLESGSTISYTLSAPLISPTYYELKATVITEEETYEEFRSWVIAVDPLNYYISSQDQVQTYSDGGFTQADGGDYTDTAAEDCSGGTCTSSNSWITGFQNFANAEPYDCELNATMSFNVSDLNLEYVENITITWSGCWDGDENLGNAHCGNSNNPEFETGTGGGSFDMKMYNGSEYIKMTCLDTVGSECGAGNEINLGTATVAPSWGNADSYNTFRFFSTDLSSNYVTNDLINITWRVFGTNVCGATDTLDDILLVIDYANLTVGWEYLIKSGAVSTVVGDEPFYTNDSNPQNYSDVSCLQNMMHGQACNVTWNVNATGGINTKHEFYVIVNSSDYSSYVAQNESKHINITIKDTSGVPPVVTLVSPANGDSQSDVTTQFNCSVTDNSGLTNVTLYANFTGTWMANETSTLSGTSDSALFSLDLSQGVYEWNCLAFDSNSNTDWGTTNYTVTIDRDSPIINLNYPGAGDSFYVSNLDFNFTVTDNLDSVLVCNLTVDGNITHQNFNANSGEVTSKVVYGLNQSTHYWNITCMDDADNWNISETRNFIVAELPPNVTLVTANNTFFGSPNITLEYTADDNNNVTLATLIFNGLENVSTIDPADGMTENFQVYNLAEGVYNWTVNVSDISNLTDVAEIRYLTIDFTPPEINLSAPANDSSWNISNLDFNFTAYDNLDANLSCSLYINNTVWDGTFETFTGNLTSRPIASLNDGYTPWYVQCVDSANNSNVSQTWYFNISETPNVTLNYPLDNHSQSSQSITFNYTPEDNTALDTCILVLNGVDNETDSSPSNGNDSFFNLEDLNFGNYNWTVRCNDTSGFTYAPAVRNFVLDNGIPEINLSAPLPGQVIDSKNIVFNYTAYDDVDFSLVCNITLDGTDNVTGIVSANGSLISTNVTVGNDGLHYWNVTCIDDAGNSNISETRNFTTRNPPDITLVAPSNNTIYNYSQDVNFTYLALDNDGVANSSLVINGVKVKDNITSVGASNNYFYYNFSSDGIRVWTVNATDTSGLEGTVTELFITIDTTPPSVIYHTPNNTETITTNNVSFVFEPYDNLASSLVCNYTVDGIVQEQNITVSNGTNTTRYEILYDGSHNWSVDCRDEVNNTNVNNLINFTVAAPPNVTLNFPPHGYRNTSVNITFNYTPEDAIGFENCSIWLDDSVYNSTTNIVRNVPNYFEVNNIAEGDHNWTIQCVDKEPDANSYNASVRYLAVDLSGPNITLIDPSEAETLNDGDVLFNWSAVDYNDSITVNCNLTLNGVLNQTGISGLSGYLNVTVANLTDGPHNWSVSCIDDLSNPSTSAIGNFSINQPDLYLNASLVSFSNSNPDENELITITANVSNIGGNTANSVNVSFWDGDPAASGIYLGSDVDSVVVNSSTLFTINWAITEGYHTVYVSTDPQNVIGELNETNNNATKNISIIKINITYPPNVTVTSDNTPEMHFNISDFTGGALNYTIFVDGVANGQSGNVSDKSNTSIDINALTDGQHLIIVQALDALDRIKNSTPLTITVDTSYPDVLFITNNATWFNIQVVNISFNITDEVSTNLDYWVFLDDVFNHTNSTTSGSIENLSFANMAEGEHTVIIESQDELGNRGNSTVLYFYVDITNPFANITTPNTTWFNTNTPTIEFNITDNLDSPINYTLFVDDSADSSGEVNNASAGSDSLSSLANGTYVILLQAMDGAGNLHNSSPITIYIDTVLPLVNLTYPDNNTNHTTTTLELNFTPTDNMADYLICNLTLDGTVVGENLQVNNNSEQNVTVSDLTGGYHYWNVTCLDRAGNSNISETRRFYIIKPDIYVNATTIYFSNIGPKENETINITATISNIGNSGTDNFLVGVWRGHPDSGGTQINGNFTMNLTAGESKNVTVNYTTIIGIQEIFVLADIPLSINGSISEENESNNIASKNLTVGMWHFAYGNTNDKIVVTDAIYRLLFDWNIGDSTGSNLFVVDTDSSITWQQLQAFGRNTTNDSVAGDFTDFDIAMGAENFTDSVNLTYTLGGSIRESRTYGVYTNTINNVPTMNSTNNTNFKTGLLWDYSDGGTQYSGTQDVVLISEMNESLQGYNSTNDFEIRIPATLRDYLGPDSSGIDFYIEIK